MRYLLMILFSFFSCVQLHVAAQSTVLYDSSGITQRSYDEAAIKKYKKDPAFDYDKIKEPSTSLWDRFWSWFWYQIDQLLSTREGKQTFWLVSIIFGIIVVAFVVYKIRKMNRAGMFGRSSGAALQYQTNTDDIHAIDFEEEIAQAIQQQNYRLAIRLMYLQTLKLLTDKALIQWQINKTNYEYLKELQSHTQYDVFKKLTHHFEYVWYGDLEIHDEAFQQIKSAFKQFNTLV